MILTHDIATVAPLGFNVVTLGPRRCQGKPSPYVVKQEQAMAFLSPEIPEPLGPWLACTYIVYPISRRVSLRKEICARLWALRQKALEEGMKPQSVDALLRELKERRGDR